MAEEDCKTAEVYDAKKGDLHYISATLRKKFNLTFPQIVIQSGLYDLNNHIHYMPKEIIYAQLNQEFERIGSAKKGVYNRNRNKNRFPYSDTLKIRLKQSWSETLFCYKQLIAVKKYDEVSKEVLIHEYKGGKKPIELSTCKKELVRLG
ncbi:hypothetical protein [Bacillus cereus]